jgi:malonyl-CoA O-methyltransferase
MSLTGFAKAARTYHEHAHVQEALAAWLAEWLPSNRAGRALEIGAGPGIFTRHLTDWAGRVTATDLSPEMCAVGRERVPEADWQIMAAEHPLPGPWSWIFSSAMLQWAQAPEEIFTKWREQLAPGGRVLAGIFVAGSLPEWHAVTGHTGALTWRTPADWRVALAHAGLRVVRDSVQQRVFHYPSAHGFLQSLHGVGAAPVRRNTPGQLRRWLSAYDAQFRSTPSGVPATWLFYRFEAERPRVTRHGNGKAP